MTIAAVTAINVKSKFALLESGRIALFTNMIDYFGYETNDPNECYIAIFQLSCGKWACCNVLEYENIDQINKN